MSYSRMDGKDEIHFVTEADLNHISGDKTPVQQSATDEQYPGAVSPDGNINWDCPCLGGLGTEGPCVDSFREAFSCWFFSESEGQGDEAKAKGEECVQQFFDMSDCMKANSEFYDDLNERNKAAAEKSRAEYEAAMEEPSGGDMITADKDMITAGEDIDLDVLEADSQDKLIFETITDLADAPSALDTAPSALDTAPAAPDTKPVTNGHLLDESYSDKVYNFSSVIVAASSDEEEKEEG